MRDKSFSSKRLNHRVPLFRFAHHPRLAALFLPVLLLFLFLLFTAVIPGHGRIKREKDTLQYGEGLIVNIPLPEPEVAQVTQDVAQNTIIHGTKEYNQDEYIAGAVEATSTPVFPAWTEGGKVFYKIRNQALDPRNFKDSGDLGILAVRYVVQPQGDKNAILRIDAVFVDDVRHATHASNGSVETSEYKDIQDRLDAIELMKKETAEAEQAKQERLVKQKFAMGNDSNSVTLSTPPATTPGADISEKLNGGAPSPSPSPSMPASASDLPAESLEQRVADLRRQVERLVKKPGAPLKSAPFHTASTMTSLEPGTEVLIMVETPYWYGVETHDGQHGWLRRDQLEQLP